MRHYSKQWNSPENKRKRSERSQRAARIRWDRELAEREPRPEPIECFLTLTAENHATGKVTVLTFHPGTRKNNTLIKIDGHPWETCGHIEAIKKVLSSIYQARTS